MHITNSWGIESYIIKKLFILRTGFANIVLCLSLLDIEHYFSDPKVEPA